MTDIEQKALALLNEVAVERGYNIGAPADRRTHYLLEVACRAIEQHEAFRQEVSDAVEWVVNSTYMPAPSEHKLRRFIIAKPDPLVEALEEASGTNDPVEWANRFYAAIEKRGGKITWGEG